MSVFKELIESAQNGKKYKIDLKNKSLKINNKQIVTNGEYDESLILIKEDDLSFKETSPWKIIGELYDNFYRSVPSESSGRAKSYFKGLTADELTDEELFTNMPRYEARAMLEGYILLASLSGILKWDFDEKWFWKDEERKGCLIFKEWIVQTKA